MKDFKTTPGSSSLPPDSARHARLIATQLSPEMIDHLKKHFWCDFSDVIPALKWDDEKTSN